MIGSSGFTYYFLTYSFKSSSNRYRIPFTGDLTKKNYTENLTGDYRGYLTEEPYTECLLAAALN